jgi:hypothetical protein
VYVLVGYLSNLSILLLSIFFFDRSNPSIN